MITPIYERIGDLKLVKGDKNNLEAVKHQKAITMCACMFEVGNCVEDAKEMFRSWQAKPSNGNP